MLQGIPEGAHEKNKQQAQVAVPALREPGLRSQGRRAQAVATLQSSGYIINEPGLKA